MDLTLNRLFDDPDTVKEISTKLPYLFQLAELESSRNGKIGMEVGSVRERILIALLMHKFGRENVNADIPITAPEIDVMVHGVPYSIKTVTVHGNSWSTVKLIWTVDPYMAHEFKERYVPSCDMLIAKIYWNGQGKLMLFSKQSQQDILRQIGRDEYIKLPKESTNSRGVEISAKALSLLENCADTRCIPINFVRTEMNYKEVYTKWLNAWEE